MRKLIIIFVAVILSSCSRKIVQSEYSDTVYISSMMHDSIYIEKETVRVDSVVVHDSIVITKTEQGCVVFVEKFRTKDSFIDLTQTHYGANVSKKDSSFVDKKTYEEKYIPPEDSRSFGIIALLLAIAAVWGIIKIFRR